MATKFKKPFGASLLSNELTGRPLDREGHAIGGCVMAQRKQCARKVLLLDDDHAFAGKLETALVSAGIELIWRKSLFELGSVGRLGNFDALIVDPQIGPVNGLEVAQYADTFFPGLPVLLAANGATAVTMENWPGSVVGLLLKDLPVSEVVDRIFGMLSGERRPFGIWRPARSSDRAYA